MVTVIVRNKTKHGEKPQTCTMWAHYQPTMTKTRSTGADVAGT